MNIMNKSKIVNLLDNMCCNVCHHDFDEKSVNVIRENGNIIVLKIVCAECGKDFGISLLKNEEASQNTDTPLEFQKCPLPIDYDEILDGHNFIGKLEKDWLKYIPDDFK